MGRAERRKQARNNKVSLSRSKLEELRFNTAMQSSKFCVEALMSCFALAMHRIHGYSDDDIETDVNYIKSLMDDVLSGKTTIENYKQELEDETGFTFVSK